MVGVRPCVRRVVHRVGEGIDGVAAAVSLDKGSIVQREGYAVAADCQLRCRGSKGIRLAVDGGVGVGVRREALGNDIIDELPRVAVARAVGVGVGVGHCAEAVGGDVCGRVGGACRGDHLATAGIREGCGCRCRGLVCAGDGRAAVLRDVQCRQVDDVRVGPVVAVVGAVGERVGVGYRAFAACGVGVDGGVSGGERVAAGIRDIRDMRGRHDDIGKAADGVKAVCGSDGEVLGRDMEGVAPRVVRSVDSVVIDERGVAATVGECGGVRTRFKRDGCAAVGDDG